MTVPSHFTTIHHFGLRLWVNLLGHMLIHIPIMVMECSVMINNMVSTRLITIRDIIQ